jgi:hypothetical protein
MARAVVTTSCSRQKVPRFPGMRKMRRRKNCVMDVSFRSFRSIPARSRRTFGEMQAVLSRVLLRARLRSRNQGLQSGAPPHGRDLLPGAGLSHLLGLGSHRLPVCSRSLQRNKATHKWSAKSCVSFYLLPAITYTICRGVFCLLLGTSRLSLTLSFCLLCAISVLSGLPRPLLPFVLVLVSFFFFFKKLTVPRPPPLSFHFFHCVLMWWHSHVVQGLTKARCPIKYRGKPTAPVRWHTAMRERVIAATRRRLRRLWTS